MHNPLVLLLCVLLGLSAVSPLASAGNAAIRDIDVDVRLQKDGNAIIYEHWNVRAVSGTEWYLVKSNLGDIRVEDLGVSDETGRKYTFEGEWDVNRSIEEKAGRCGIVTKRNGVELCWGIGTFGDHVFDVHYTMTRCVKALDDYDYLHIQFVSPRLSSTPKHVRVSISFPGESLDTSSTRVWGFGYGGTVAFTDGKVVFESSERFSEESSVIALLRFNKGLFSPESSRSGSFSEVLDIALEGSSFGGGDEDGELPFFVVVLMFLSAIGGSIGLCAASIKQKRKRILGIPIKEVEWSRDIPFGGNIPASAYTLEQTAVESNPTQALVLRLIYKGSLSATKSDSEVLLSHSEEGGSSAELDDCERTLLEMIREASGSDGILRKKEFSRWAEQNVEKIEAYNNLCSAQGKKYLKDKLYLEGRQFTPDGQKNARNLLGLKMFLKDFTLVGERETPEVSLWKEYLVFGALFGIAETVAKQLKDINTEVFEQEIGFDLPTIDYILLMSHNMSSSMSRAQEAAREASSSRGGFGGGASFGGGGGFSGGGFGGGSR